jgi:hypothetical protein
MAYLSSYARVAGDDSATVEFRVGVETGLRPVFFYPEPDFLKTTIFNAFGMVLAQ